MHNHLPTLWADALTAPDRDAWVSDWALSSIWGDDPASDPPAERIDHLCRIWDASHMTVDDIRKAAGLKQVQLAARFNIPRRTLQDWCRGIATPPDHIRQMMCELLGLI